MTKPASTGGGKPQKLIRPGCEPGELLGALRKPSKLTATMKRRALKIQPAGKCAIIAQLSRPTS